MFIFKTIIFFYKQKFGLPMDSPLSDVIACIYLEFLKSGPFRHIIPSNSNHFRYVDVILFIYPKELDLIKVTDRLNKIKPTIKFIHELETNNALPFSDIILIRNNDKLEFKVFHKTTGKNDYIHSYSRHKANTKIGVIKAFYFKALCIYSPKYLDDEFNCR